MLPGGTVSLGFLSPQAPVAPTERVNGWLVGAFVLLFVSVKVILTCFCPGLLVSSQKKVPLIN